MATYYHDSTNGDDANNGTTSALAKKTLAAGAALCTVAGDVLLSTNGGGGAEPLAATVTFPAVAINHLGCNSSFVVDGTLYRCEGTTNSVNTGISYPGSGTMYFFIDTDGFTLNNIIQSAAYSCGFYSVLRNCGNYAARLSGNFSSLWHCSIQAPASQGVSTAGLGCAIEGCYIEGGTTSAITASGAAIIRQNVLYRSGTRAGQGISGVVNRGIVMNNWIENFTNGILVAIGSESFIMRNRIVNNDTGIRMTNAGERIVLQGNGYYGNTNDKVFGVNCFSRDLGGETVMSSTGKTGATDWTTLTTAELRRIAYAIGEGNANYGSMYLDAGTQSNDAAGGGRRPRARFHGV